MTFGERLTELRIENGYHKRNEFADALGIPSTTLRNYETNVREPGHKFLKQISTLFNVSVDYLLCLTDNREKTDSYQLKSSEFSLIEKYRDLDLHGKDMVDTVLEKEHDRCKEYSKILTLHEKDRSYLEPVAAHERTDKPLTLDGKLHDDDIMNDDSEWK